MSWITPPPRKDKPLPPAMAVPKRKGIAAFVVVVPTVIGLVSGLLASLVVQATWARILVVVVLTGVGAFIGVQTLVTSLIVGARYEKEH